MVGSSSDQARIILEMVSHRSRIVIDVSSVLEKCFSNFGESFCVASAVFGDVGGCHLLFRAL